ncbi:MAG: DNA-binding response regulator [Bacteroidetes bacterium]|nr:MAG: DNA-binding response regulator [Bacteroidota bacterium]
MNDRANILLVEDEPNLHHSLKLNLSLEGYDVTSAFDGAQALQSLQDAYFDLVVLDLMLPNVDGITVLETLRLNKIDTPVLILSARANSASRIEGLRAGANDYLTKPFALEELLLRVQNLLAGRKNAGPATTDGYAFGGHVLQFSAQQAKLANGHTIELSKKEAMLLQLLVQHAGEVVTREKILQTVWGYQVFPTTRTIDNFILNFRKYFEEDSRNPRHFHAVRSMGYKFTP